MRKIDIMIVGAQKAGSTSLNNYLSEHPDIIGHPQTEFSYFRSDEEYQEDYDTLFKKYFTKGDINAKYALAKNVGIYDNEKAIKRLHEHNPNCKIILLVREPVSRAISSYNMEKFNGYFKRDFEEVKNVIENKKYEDSYFRLIINLGLYANHLKCLLKYFPSENIGVYLFEDLKSDPEGTYKKICKWIGIDDTFTPNLETKHNQTFQPKSKVTSNILLKLRKNDNPIKKIVKGILPYSTFTKLGNFLLESNKSKKKPEQISKEMKDYLYGYFKPFNEDLKRMTDIDFSIWEKTTSKK